MSTEIKPGQIWAWRDTDAAKGPHGSQFEIVNAAPHVLDVAYQYPHAAGFDPERVYASRAEVIAANAMLIRCSCRTGTDDTCEDHSATPAPSPEVIEAVNVLRDAGIRSAEDFDRLVAHQPAPKPEWKPGTTGTAVLAVGADAGRRVEVVRLTGREVILDGSVELVWADLDGARYGEFEVTEFVPDEPRPLPTREQVSDTISHAMDDHGDPDVAADWVLALLRGESR